MKVIIIRKEWPLKQDHKIGGIDITFKNLALEMNGFCVTQENTFNVCDYNLIFLHINNDEAKPFFISLTDDQKDKIILFSTDPTLSNKKKYFWCNEDYFMGRMRKWESFERLNWHKLNKIELGIDRKKIIEILKPDNKEHLIALSILCQGYLAAHGKTDYLEGWKEVWANLQDDLQDKEREMTELRSWWEPALGNDYKGDELKNELKTEDKLNDAIECLREIIHNKEDDKGNKYFENGGATDSHRLKDEEIIKAFTEKVNAAYGQLKNILGATK